VTKKTKKIRTKTLVSSKKCNDSVLCPRENKYIGRKIAKKFSDNVYFGTVDQYDPSGCLWHVTYSDGDEEELERETIKNGIALYRNIQVREMADPRWKFKVDRLCLEFRSKKNAILSQLSQETKSSFMKIGFARWSVKFRPVLFLGPHDVSPGPVRDTWMEEFKRHSKNPNKMNRLVYWYGTPNYANAFSLISAKDCISYEKGVEKGMTELPANIQRKFINNLTLTNHEKYQIQGIKDMKEDVNLQSCQKKAILKFKEDHELVQDGLLLLSDIR